MSMLRKPNSKIGATTGYQVRRVPAPSPAPGNLGAIPTPRGPRPERTAAEAVRKQVDPGVDRLLERPVFLLTSVRSGSP